MSASEDRRKVEQTYLEFRSRLVQGEELDFETFARGHPSISEELTQMHASFCSLAPELESLPSDAGGESLSRLLDPGALLSMPFDAEPARHHADILQRLADRPRDDHRYEVKEAVGQGGMGVVHRVRDLTLDRDLAMKVLHPDNPSKPAGTDEAPPRDKPQNTVGFLDEALITGQLDHPGIVPVHDVGLDPDGRVFFTMKLVKGRDLRSVLDGMAKGEKGWTQNRVVGVLLRVCEAVAYAHSKGVLHRDIKPANIMLGRYGETFLMDWGLAHILDVNTETCPLDGQAPVGTPSYMSPEQADRDSAEVDERTDIYSLGAILYHLLTGRVPYVQADMLPIPFTLLVKLRQGPPPPVTELAPAAPPSLVKICEHAMARDKGDRYATATEMAAELQDYLEDISEDREEARRQARRAELINAFLVEMLGRGDPERALGHEVTVREVLDHAAASIKTALSGQPLDQSALQGVIGTLYRKLGHYEEAGEHLQGARDLARDTLGPDHRDTLSATTELALLHQVAGRSPEAEELVRDTWERQRAALDEEHLDTVRSMFILAEVLQRSQAGLDEAESLLKRVVAIRRAALGDEAHDTLSAQNSLAFVMQEQGRPQEAVPILKQVVSALGRRHGQTHPTSLVAVNDLAGLYAATGQLDQAEPLYRRALAGQSEVLGEAHPRTLTTQNNLAQLLHRRGQTDEADQLLEKAAAAAHQAFGPDHPNTVGITHNRGLALLERGRPEEAEQVLRTAVDAACRSLGNDHRHTARFRHNLGRALVTLGRDAEAEHELSAAFDVLLSAVDSGHAWRRETASALATLLRGQGREEEARRFQAEADAE